jgi:hypothetical protein
MILPRSAEFSRSWRLDPMSRLGLRAVGLIMVGCRAEYGVAYELGCVGI